ncbi:hypothetical protein PLICRDRAFT_39915 [Plicaturopsis crispa FD-325 SS-3]|nr:hypothetical protein PLICRDRAFT_39915 [Plicaturopsis crispa FD-325 SS-3]
MTDAVSTGAGEESTPRRARLLQWGLSSRPQPALRHRGNQLGQRRSRAPVWGTARTQIIVRVFIVRPRTQRKRAVSLCHSRATSRMCEVIAKVEIVESKRLSAAIARCAWCLSRVLNRRAAAPAIMTLRCTVISASPCRIVEAWQPPTASSQLGGLVVSRSPLWRRPHIALRSALVQE